MLLLALMMMMTVMVAPPAQVKDDNNDDDDNTDAISVAEDYRNGLKPVSYSSGFVWVFHTVEHGPQFSQPITIHCGYTLHILL